MLGWHINVFRTDALTHLVYDATIDETRLASWSTGIKGLDWLNKLANENKILNLGGNGYPYRYSAKASEILPIISSGIPTSNEPIIIGDDYVLHAHEIRSLKLDALKISKCELYDHILIEAWDQS
jgi:hypothetical protein